jgi:hypothetical protein
VGVVDEGPQERDRDRLDPLGDEAVDRGDRLVLTQLDDHVAVDVDALGHAADELARHDRHRLLQPRGVHEIALGEARALRVDLADDDRVLVAPGGDEAGLRAGAREDGVRGDRRAVHEQVRALQQLRPCEPEPLGVDGDGAEHAVGERAMGRERLGHVAAARLVDDDAVGERAADVHADSVAQVSPPARVDVCRYLA